MGDGQVGREGGREGRLERGEESEFSDLFWGAFKFYDDTQGGRREGMHKACVRCLRS